MQKGEMMGSGVWATVAGAEYDCIDEHHHKTYYGNEE